MSKLFNKVIDKVTSGRFILTIILTGVYAYLAIKNQLTSEFNTTYAMIVVFYFTRQRDSSGKDDSSQL